MTAIINRILDNLATRLMFIIYVLFIVVTVFFISFGYYQELGLQKERQYDKLKGVVAVIASSIDGDSHEYMMKNYDSNLSQESRIAKSVYDRLSKKLNKGENAAKTGSTIYTLTRDKRNGKFFYGVRSDDFVDINNEYRKVPDELVKNYKVGGVIPIYESENGTWLSAFHPIKNSKNEVVALLEADIEFSMFKKIVNNHFFKRLVISLLVILLIFVFFIRYAKKVLKEEAENQSQLAQQKKVIESKNKDITDSMHYALKIQKTILPPTTTFKENFDDCFIFYKSKDIVAGDFYWLERIGDDIFIAVADCTGHGVPGAILSIICANILNSVIVETKINDTAEILDNVRQKVIAYLTSGDFAMNDGMDISLCKINLKTRELQYTGANNSIYIVKNGELKILKACKQPIGKYDFAKDFKSTCYHLAKGEMVYMFTDGYADQFGGPNSKKFKYKNFRSLLLQSSTFSNLEEQRNAIEKAFLDWKGNEEQIDDICVVGIRV
ncbi:MAG: PP2C family protein-serine/threonine phosphatase [Crocinitomicaceae bacterium]